VLAVQAGHMFLTVDSVTRRDGKLLRPLVLERVETERSQLYGDFVSPISASTAVIYYYRTGLPPEVYTYMLHI